MGNTCKPMAVSFKCMTKFTTEKKKKRNYTPIKFLKRKKKSIENENTTTKDKYIVMVNSCGSTI